MAENTKPFAFFSLVALYTLYFIALSSSFSRTVRDEYFVHDALINIRDCGQIAQYLSGTVSCPVTRRIDGSRQQRIVYQASIWNDIATDRIRLEPYNEARDATIDNDNDWVRPALIGMFIVLPAVELLWLLWVFWGSPGRDLQTLETRERRRAARSIFIARAGDYRFSVAVFLFGGVSLFFLARWGWIPTRDLGAVSILAFVLGLGGAAYAILSKLMADKVFDHTLEIHQSITSFFGGYDMITDEDDDKSALKMISNAKSSLVIYTGSPLVAFYRDPQAGLLVSSRLTSKIQEMTRRHKFAVKLMYYSDEREKKYLEAFRQLHRAPIQGKSADQWCSEYLEAKKTLLDTIRNMPDGAGKVYQHPDEEPQVRFIIQDGKRALFWILEAANPAGAAADAQRSKASAAGFSTNTWHMINILLGLFANAESAALAAAAPGTPTGGGGHE